MAKVLVYFCDKGQHNNNKFYIICSIIFMSLDFVFFNAQTSEKVEQVKIHKCNLSYKQTTITPD